MTLKKGRILTLFLIIDIIVIAIFINKIVAYWSVALVCLLICIFWGRKEECLVNPFLLFALTPFTLLIYRNISDTYMMDLTKETWLIAILNIGAFISALSYISNGEKRVAVKPSDEQLYTDAIILAVAGFVPSLLFLVFGIAVPLYSIFGLLTVPALMCAIKLKNARLIIVFMLLYGITWINNVSKSTILTTCLAFLIGFEKYFVKSKKHKRWFFILCVVGLVIVILSFTFANQNRGMKSAEGQLAYYTKYGGVTWNGAAALFMPYMYLETPWTNLQYVMQSQDTRTFGLWLIKPLLGYLQIDSLLAEHYQLIPMSSFNTYTFIACQFKDFGMGGSILISALLGIFVRYVYTKYKSSEDPLDAACYVYVAQAVLEMFFSNHFFQQSYPFTIVALIVLYKCVFRKIKIILHHKD